MCLVPQEKKCYYRSNSEKNTFKFIKLCEKHWANIVLFTWFQNAVASSLNGKNWIKCSILNRLKTKDYKFCCTTKTWGEEKSRKDWKSATRTAFHWTPLSFNIFIRFFFSLSFRFNRFAYKLHTHSLRLLFCFKIQLNVILV